MSSCCSDGVLFVFHYSLILKDSVINGLKPLLCHRTSA